MKIIIFRHLPDDGYESAFETGVYQEGKVIKEMVVPGLFGFKDIYYLLSHRKGIAEAIRIVQSNDSIFNSGQGRYDNIATTGFYATSWLAGWSS